MTTPTDPLFGSQWHFALLGDIQTIWNEYNGSGVHIAVYDDGIEYTHPDLAGNYDSSMHFQYGGITYDPMPLGPNAGHGTSVAGLIAAIGNNGIGGVGVAFGATLTGVNYLDDIQFQSTNVELAALLYAQNFDIMSNSWGRQPGYDPSQSLADPSSAVGLSNGAFGEVVEFGRGGLGTIIVQAAGNDAMNANGDGLNASRFTTSIAATDASGNVMSYSNFGASILIAAPAGSVTTDLQGTAGYNTAVGTAGDYTNAFGGTSAATPIVSGVVALMLDANSGLGWRDVQNILAISASQTGSAYGSAGTGYEVGAWSANGAANWNGGGMTFHPSYGFGMLDAFAAVRMAEVWTTMYGAAATSANEQTVTASYTGPDVGIPDYSGGVPGVTEIDLVVTQNIEIEDIYVTVDMTHSWSADLVLVLIGPNGEEIQLMANEGGSTLMDGGFRWTFGVTAALGMLSAGTWTLRITDTAIGDVGTVSGVTIDFFGAQASVNDVYHFTQDLFDLIAVEAARATISDTNGGADWLNFAAMGSIDITVRLDNRVIDFSTQQVSLTIAQDTLIENVVTGDGNDTIVGNTANNYLMGMRGNDSLSGGSGDDTLGGGAGNDQLNGGLGNDRLDGGLGTDTAMFIGSTMAVTVNLNLTGAQNTGHGVDTLLGIENVTSGAGRDNLVGNAGANMLNGGLSNDTLSGGGGNDTLLGGGGTDELTGGTGADTFIFNTALGASNIDLITDFNVVDDTIRLENAIFTGLVGGVLSVAEFASNLTGFADDLSDRIIYETDTGRLYFDPDGTGALERIHFATLAAGLALTNADFFVF